ncbi:MAG TPA: hypothetical protein VNT81_21550 [Vicinamibacterales bacterium]|nr:hypothetical protein [Vicinamibacterales bacterium]
MSELNLRIGIERRDNVIHLVVRSVDQPDDAAIALPLSPDLARGIATDLYDAARDVDPVGHERLIRGLLSDVAHSLALAVTPPQGKPS